MDKLYTQVSYPIRNHIYVIVSYSLFVFAMNYLGNKQISVAALAPMVAINIAVFYSLNMVGNNFFAYQRSGWMVIQLLALIVGWYILVYLLIYEFFPGLGQRLFEVRGEFHLGKYIRNVTSYLEKSLLAVVIYQLAKLSTVRHLALLNEKEKTIAKERELKEVAENHLILEREARSIERENMQLRFTVQSAQLKSHWLHRVTVKVRDKIISGGEIISLFDAYQEVLNYYYKHGGPDAKLVTLEDEVHLIKLMKLLNEALNDGRETLTVKYNKQMIARQLPPFLISTLLENAFKFGDQSVDSKPIELTLSSLPNQLSISCFNVIDPARAAAAPKSGVGLTNIQHQLDYFMPGKNNITIENDGVSFKITITIVY